MGLQKDYLHADPASTPTGEQDLAFREQRARDLSLPQKRTLQAACLERGISPRAAATLPPGLVAGESAWIGTKFRATDAGRMALKIAAIFKGPPECEALAGFLTHAQAHYLEAGWPGEGLGGLGLIRPIDHLPGAWTKTPLGWGVLHFVQAVKAEACVEYLHHHELIEVQCIAEAGDAGVDYRPDPIFVDRDLVERRHLDGITFWRISDHGQRVARLYHG